MTSNRKTLGFGCPNDIDPHHFVVTIPAGRSGAVTVTEHFGLLGGANGIPEQEDRAVIPRAHWNRIADSVKRVFNERLKANKLPPSRWKPGANKIERLLGKELCVLAWGIEKVELNRAPVTLKNWSGFKRGALVALQHDRRERGHGRRQRARVAARAVPCLDRRWGGAQGTWQTARAAQRR